MKTLWGKGEFILFFFLKKFMFSWSIVDLQCCVNFFGTAKWLSYPYDMHMFFFIFFSIMVYLRILSIVPCAIQWTLLFTLSVCNSLPLLTPHSSNLDRLLHLPRCGWSHLVICCITLAVTPVVMHSNLRDCAHVFPQFSVQYYTHALLEAATYWIWSVLGHGLQEIDLEPGVWVPMNF